VTTNWHRIDYRGYRTGWIQDPGRAAVQAMVNLLTAEDHQTLSPLGGRGGTRVRLVAGVGAVVIKHYLRGGLIRHLTRATHLTTGKCRGQMEAETLCRVNALGINVPQPVAWASAGGFFCQTWLATREITDHTGLDQLALSGGVTPSQVRAPLADAISRLIRHRILHVDLHPGNVLFQAPGSVFIIDFDRAKEYKRPRSSLLERYAHRWQRAVKKHCLPAWLAEDLFEIVTRKLEESA